MKFSRQVEPEVHSRTDFRGSGFAQFEIEQRTNLTLKGEVRKRKKAGKVKERRNSTKGSQRKKKKRIRSCRRPLCHS
jgi:hypothetical protein